MESFAVVAGIRIRHGYYKSLVNHNIELKQTRETEELTKRRGMVFVKASDNEWQWLIPAYSTGFMADDILEVSMIVDDPDFLRKINIKDYTPLSFYQVCLGKEAEIDLANGLQLVMDKKKQGREICRMTLNPLQGIIEKVRRLLQENSLAAEEVLEETKRYVDQMPKYPLPMYTITIQSPDYTWEYLFVFRDESDSRGQYLKLENIAVGSNITFESPKILTNSSLGKNIWQIVSSGPIKLQAEYEASLVLTESSGNDRKRVVSRFIDFPKPGKYITDRPDMIREVCYL